MPPITAHASEPSAPRSTCSVMGSLALGFERCPVCLRLAEATPMGLCGGSRRFDVEGLREGFEAEPGGSSFSPSLTRDVVACLPSTLSHRRCIRVGDLGVSSERKGLKPRHRGRPGRGRISVYRKVNHG
jgi:hypothetical protein